MPTLLAHLTRTTTYLFSLGFLAKEISMSMKPAFCATNIHNITTMVGCLKLATMKKIMIAATSTQAALDSA